MTTTLLTYNDGINISGSFTTIIDLFFNLDEYIDVKLKIHFDFDPLGMMRYFKHNRYFGDDYLMACLTKKIYYDDDIIIMSCELMAQLAQNQIQLDIVCDKLILLDSLDLHRYLYKIIPHFSTNMRYNECILLGNIANHDILSVDSIEYYHKFSRKRINSLSMPMRELNYCRADKKHIMLADGLYFENIGKSIFENIAKGNIVNYDPTGLKIVDGLCYYLNLFEVDPFIEHKPLKIGQDELNEKLFFHKEDKILELL